MSNIDRVREFVVEELLFGDDDNMTYETSFYDTSLIDSIGMVRLISFIEEAFNI